MPKLLKSLKIENFQSHPNTEVEFADGVTAFVGESTHGKSAILRALKLLWYNKPNNISISAIGQSLPELQ